MDVAVITAVLGGYDRLRPPAPQTHPVAEWLCVTDEAGLTCPPWQPVVVAPGGLGPRLAAKRPKFRPDRYTRCDTSIWIDACQEIVSQAFVDEALACLDVSGWALHAHPDRDDIVDEARVSLTLRKYAGLPLLAQAEHYTAEGHPRHWGLWAGGVIVRRHTPAMAALGEAWWQETLRWTIQDQLSLPVLFRRFGIRPAVFPHRLWECPWYVRHEHLAPDR